MSSPIPAVSCHAYRVAAMLGTDWVRARVKQALDHAGIAVDTHLSSRSFLAALQDGSADVGLMEDSAGGLDACLAGLRFQGAASVPIVVMGDGSMRRMASALRHGASDYATHDESPDRLVNRLCARIEAWRDQHASRELTVGECRLEADSRMLDGPAGGVVLTPREFGLAWLLFEHAGRVVSLRTLSTQVWGRDPSLSKRTMEQHVCLLRRKLRQAGGPLAAQIQAINSVGYRLVPRAAAGEDGTA